MPWTLGPSEYQRGMFLICSLWFFLKIYKGLYLLFLFFSLVTSLFYFTFLREFHGIYSLEARKLNPHIHSRPLLRFPRTVWALSWDLISPALHGWPTLTALKEFAFIVGSSRRHGDRFLWYDSVHLQGGTFHLIVQSVSYHTEEILSFGGTLANCYKSFADAAKVWKN